CVLDSGLSFQGSVHPARSPPRCGPGWRAKPPVLSTVRGGAGESSARRAYGTPPALARDACPFHDRTSRLMRIPDGGVRALRLVFGTLLPIGALPLGLSLIYPRSPLG